MLHYKYGYFYISLKNFFAHGKKYHAEIKNKRKCAKKVPSGKIKPIISYNRQLTAINGINRHNPASIRAC